MPFGWGIKLRIIVCIICDDRVRCYYVLEAFLTSVLAASVDVQRWCSLLAILPDYELMYHVVLVLSLQSPS